MGVEGRESSWRAAGRVKPGGIVGVERPLLAISKPGGMGGVEWRAPSSREREVWRDGGAERRVVMLVERRGRVGKGARGGKSRLSVRVCVSVIGLVVWFGLSESSSSSSSSNSVMVSDRCITSSSSSYSDGGGSRMALPRLLAENNYRNALDTLSRPQVHEAL